MAEIAQVNDSFERVDEKNSASDGVINVDSKEDREAGAVAAPVSEKKQSISDFFTIVSAAGEERGNGR